MHQILPISLARLIGSLLTLVLLTFTAPVLASDDLVVDFGAIGLWARMNDASWLKLSNTSPTEVVTGDVDANGEDDVIAVFAGGIFIKRNLGAWVQLHNTTPDSMAIGDLDSNGQDDVVIDFGDIIGLYARMNDTSWVKLSNTSPSQIATGDMDGNGADDVIAVFAGGVFIKRNLGGWAQLHNTIPDSMAVGDLDSSGQDDVVIDFGASIGLYARMNDASWLKLHNSSPELITTGDIDGNGADDIQATFPGSFAGLWQQLNLGAWTQLSANTADTLVTGNVNGTGAEDIIASFATSIDGIFIKRDQGDWSQLHNFNPESIAVGNLDGTPTNIDDGAIMSQLLAGGVGAVESWNETLPQFEYWRDTYDATAGTLLFIDEEYDYETAAFVDVSGFDSYWLTTNGTWELPSSIDVITPNDGDGSMVVAVRDSGDTENVANFRISAFTVDIDGDLISDYLDDNWAAQMLNPAATFGAGAQLVTSYTFESLTDSYSFELDDWCESEDPVRYAALGDSCNGVYINSTGLYATTLTALQVVNAWTDTETNDDSGLDVVSLGYEGSSNSELLAELVVTDNVVNYYVRDYDLTGEDYIVKLAETGTWILDADPGVMMIRFTIPAALQSQFPDLEEEGGLTPFFAEYLGFVRGGVLEAVGSISEDDEVFNGIALDEVLANFVPPVSLVGTWVPTAAENNPDDFLSLSFFADGTYTHGEVDFDDGGEISGMEWGTYSRGADGLLTVTQTFDNNGDTGLTNFVAPGPASIYVDVSGNLLTLSIDESGDGFIDGIIEFERVSSSELSGTWRPTAAENDPNDFVSLTFFGNGTYTHMEVDFDDVTEISGMEWGTYSIDPVTGQLTATQFFDNNGDTGLSNFVGDFAPFLFVEIVGDIFTISIDEDGDSNIDGGLVFDRSDISGGSSSGGNLPCNYESGWDDEADGGLGAPINPNSFADFEGVLASCATALSFGVADIAGKTFVDATYVDETTTFNALTGVEAGTVANPGTGTYVEPGENLTFEWYVEIATCPGCTHSYLVQYSDETIDIDLVGLSFRETSAVTNLVGNLGDIGTDYTLHYYSEQSNYSSDGLVRETGADGEIWNSVSTLQ